MALSISEVDFVAYDEFGQVLLLVEVKSRLATTELWAAQFRRNILAHGTLPVAPFFLIATADRMYFWRQNMASGIEEPPHFTLETSDELKPYFKLFHQTPEESSGQTLELIVFTWLNDIARSVKLTAKQESSLRWLTESGLISALRKARIELGAV